MSKLSTTYKLGYLYVEEESGHEVNVTETAWRRRLGCYEYSDSLAGTIVLAVDLRMRMLVRRAAKTGGQMWGGCFSDSTAPCLARLNRSIHVDKRMYAEDIKASQVYADALRGAGVLTADDCQAIVGGLDQVKSEWECGEMVVEEQDEDVHTANERRLAELVGPPAQRLHTARSRNDQVATDVRLWLLNNVPALTSKLLRLIQVIVSRAETEIDVLMPGYTHLQRAQPVRWSHFLLSHAWSVRDDVDLLRSTSRRAAVLPLGSGALAGNPFPVDRAAMAAALGFLSISDNSMHAVANRDFIEFLFWCSLCGAHMSRLAEDLIIFSTAEFGFVQLSDGYSTGSSLLPHKRNPDGLELTRAAAARLLGVTTGFLATLKGLPSTYNKDLQGDKSALFESFDTMSEVLEVMAGTVDTLTLNRSRCSQALGPEQLTARLAHWLAERGLPFRRAHHAAGRAVAAARARGLPLDQLPAAERALISEPLGGDLSGVWDHEAAVEEHRAPGGTARASVQRQITSLREWLGEQQTDNAVADIN